MNSQIKDLKELIVIQEISGKDLTREYSDKLDTRIIDLITNPYADYEIEKVLKDIMSGYVSNLKEFFNQSNDNKSYSKIYNQMNTIISLMLRYNFEKDDDTFTNFLLECTELCFSTNPTPEEQISYNGIDILLQLYNNDQLNDEQKQRCEPLFERIKTENEFGTFEKFIDVFKIYMDCHIAFDKYSDIFKKGVVMLRNYYGILPEELCDYFLSEITFNGPMFGEKLKDSDNIFGTLLEKAVEDKERHIVQQNKTEGYIVNVWPLEKGVSARCTPTAKILEFDVDHRNFSLMKVIDLWHEAQHAVQSNEKENGKISSYMSYMILKEDIIKEENPEFYNKNYAYMFEEIDAIQTSFLKFGEWIDQIQIDENKKAQIKEEIQKTLEITSVEMKKGQNKEQGGVTVNVNKILSDILKKKPEIIKEHPELLIEFNEDGTQKDAFTMLKEYDELSENGELNDRECIYDEIFKYPIGELDLNSFSQLIHFEPHTEKGKRYKQDAIINTAIPELYELYSEAYFIGSFSYIVLDEDKANEWESRIAILEECMSDDLENEYNRQIADAISPMTEEIRETIDWGCFFDEIGEFGECLNIDDRDAASHEEDALREVYEGLSDEEIQQGNYAIQNAINRDKGKEKAEEMVEENKEEKSDKESEDAR